MLYLHLHRYRIKGKSCDGTLLLNGLRLCDTAESSLHRLPVGSYRITLQYNRRLKRRVPTLDIGQPGLHTGYLAIGNGIYNACDPRILVGNYLVPGIVTHSYDHFLLLYDRIYAALHLGHEVKIRITE